MVQKRAKITPLSKLDACCLCGGVARWETLPDPLAGRSVTTDGHIVMQALAKAQCVQCGMVRRTIPLDRAISDFYGDEYAFYSRPGAENFDAARYQDMARWVWDAAQKAGNFTPEKIMEIGCGNGWTLMAMRTIHPAADYTGVEPSTQAATVAREAGLSVVQAVAGVDTLPSETSFDLIYSNNVIGHTSDPVAFLQSLKMLLNPNGRIVISCPDGTHPALDMMFSDHLFTFAPIHLVALVRKAGLTPLVWEACPKEGRMRHEQLIVCSAEKILTEPLPETSLPFWDKDALLCARREYLAAWGMLDDYFSEALGSMKHVYLFGAGEWGFLLAGYAPKTWERITACTVDNHRGSFMGKEVIPYENLGSRRVDAIIIGTNPDTQPILAARLIKQGYQALTWNHLVKR